MQNLLRLTDGEFAQVLKLAPKTKFWHINLQHSGIPFQDTASQDYVVVRIIKNGFIKDGHEVLPKLDMEHTIPVKLINFKHSIPIAEFVGHKPVFDGEKIVLDNPRGVVESLYGVYTKELGLTQDEILKMTCFLREFEVLA